MVCYLVGNICNYSTWFALSNLGGKINASVNINLAIAVQFN